MIKQPFKSVEFAWLTEKTPVADGSENNSFGETGWVDYLMSPEIGQGGYELVELGLGSSVVRSTLEFSPNVNGQWIPVMDVNVEFNEPSLQAMTVRGLRGSVREKHPAAHLAMSEGNDLFRFTSRYSSIFEVDGSFSGETCHFSIGQTMLIQLVGQPEAEALLTGLGVVRTPSITVRPIPLHISNPLLTCISPNISGPVRKLSSQAKVLDYLSLLVSHVCSDKESPADNNQKSKARSREIHEQLINCDGKLPSLEELAKQYGRSAKLLNEEFTNEFGNTIHSFFMEYRLVQAHAALLRTEVTIKQLAARLGYSHVSNFTIAFKRKFGYAPGSLKR